MKLLSWKDKIKEQPTSKGDILQKAERTEIICYFGGLLWGIGYLIGLGMVCLSPTFHTTGISLSLVVVCAAGLCALEITSRLKFERFKRQYDTLQQTEAELNHMQAEDL